MVLGSLLCLPFLLEGQVSSVVWLHWVHQLVNHSWRHREFWYCDWVCGSVSCFWSHSFWYNGEHGVYQGSRCGSICSLPFQILAHLVQTHAVLVHAAKLSVRQISHNNNNPADLERIVSSGSYSLSVSSSKGFSEPWEGCDGDLPFKDECSKVSLCIKCGSGSLYLFPSIYCRKFLWWWWERHWSIHIAECY